MEKTAFHIADLMDDVMLALQARAARTAARESIAPARPRAAPSALDAAARPHRKPHPVHFAPERS